MLQAIAALLQPEGLAVLLVGDAEIAGDRVSADAQLERLAPIAELEFVAAASQPRPDWRRGPDRYEHLVALRRANPDDDRSSRERRRTTSADHYK